MWPFFVVFGHPVASDIPHFRQTAEQIKIQDQRNLPASQKIKYTNKLLTALMDAFEAENQPIAHYLSSDKGVEFMGLDGQITEKVIEHFTNKGVPILTIHDSYIIESSYEQELKNVMQEATKQVLGDGGLTIRQVLLSEALTEEEFKRLVDEIESDPVNELRFRIKQEKLSPAAIQAVAKVDRTVNPVDALINLEDLVVRTLGYEQRYERFQRYLKEYHPDR